MEIMQQEGPVVVEDMDQFVKVFKTVFLSSPENLALLANHCSVDTLRNLRLVSPQFHRASQDAWRNKATLRIGASAGSEPVPHSQGQQHLFMELDRLVRHLNGGQILIEELSRLLQLSAEGQLDEGHLVQRPAQVQHRAFDRVLVRHLEDHLHQSLLEQLNRVRNPGDQQGLAEELARLVQISAEGQHRVGDLVQHPENHVRFLEELALLVQSPEGQQLLIEGLSLLIPRFYENVLDIREFHEMIENPDKDIFNLVNRPFKSYKLENLQYTNKPAQIPGVPPSSKLTQYFTEFGRKIHFAGGCPPFPGGYFLCLHQQFRNVEKIVFEKCYLFKIGFGLSAVRDDMSLDNVTSVQIVDPVDPCVVLTEDKARRFQRVFPNLKALTVTFNPKYGNGFWRLGSPNDFRGWQSIPGQHQENLIYCREIKDFLKVHTSPVDQLRIHVEPGYENYIRDLLLAFRLTLKGLICYCLREVEPIHAFPFHIECPSLEEMEFRGEVVTNLNFLKWMPRLKKVVIEQDLSLGNGGFLSGFQEKKLSKRLSTDFVENTYYLNLFVTMQHLVHLEIDDEIGKNNWEKLGELEVLPNLKILKTILSSGSLSVICKNWRNLKKLSLMFGSGINEKALTGIGKGLEMEGERLHIEHVANLTDLKELTDFELMTYCGGGWSKITDFSVTHGFLKMPLLKKLIICVSSEMTSGAEELLKAKIECVKVYRNDTFH